ncbi:SIR2 family NAD-dependent protein deacylase [Mycoplasmopsis pulmonis]|uniref:NAD-dependent deacetylase n=1 Tax=Mycoplasmopsis pulmonis TaxID=2107 RepID=UPI0010051556|nr:NAD-dependent deacetylase [Mycoplasmopsis pulmonis]MDZ7293547.1 NAD-dependent deacetylase [Mycoplasmopsis pulmonis]VEU68207.1 Uncharacterised protein [Mycoplasmopsis pulmonis]
MEWKINSKDPKEIFLQAIEQAELLVLGIGAGLPGSAGFGYSGERFEKNFGDFIKEYKLVDMLQASLFEYPNWPSYWAFQSRFTSINYYDQPVSESFLKLKELIKDKNYFIITTNSDSCLEKANFDEDKIFYIQGKYKHFQCSKMCHNKLYEDKELIYKMIKEQKDLLVPYELIPRCPKCDSFLEINKRIAYKGMVEDQKFENQKAKYEAFVEKAKDKKTLFLELGVGYTTPQFIKIPFQKWTQENPQSFYLSISNKTYRLNPQIKKQALLLEVDLKDFFEKF